MATPKFGGSPKCPRCGKSVFFNEEVKFASIAFHAQCFKCKTCNHDLQVSNAVEGIENGTKDAYCKKCWGAKFGVEGFRGGDGGGGLGAAVYKGDDGKAAAPKPAAAAAKPAAAVDSKPAAVAAKPAAAAAAAKPAAAAAKPAEKKVGKVDTSQKNKIFIDNYNGRDQKEPLVVKSGSEADGVFIGSCTGPELCIKIEGKVKNITVSGCKNIAVVFDTVIATVEVINSMQVAIQAVELCGSYVVDKCDRTKLYLADRSLADKVVVYSAQSCATCVYQATEDGEDQVEHGVPLQLLTTFKKGVKPVHEVVIPYQE